MNPDAIISIKICNALLQSHPIFKGSMNINHPWQSGPTELIKYAIQHLHRDDEFSQRIAFLLLGVGVETLFKTFLQLPEEVTGTKISFSERIKASEGKFHELVRGLKKAAGKRLDNVDLTHIQFYHDLRNKLYHQGNGITVPPEQTKGYASLVVECFKALLDVDLGPILFSKQEEEQRRAKEQILIEELEQLRQEIKSQLGDLHQTTVLAPETVEPALVLPSFRYQYEKWTEVFQGQYDLWSSKIFWENKAKGIVSGGKDKPEEYAAFLAEIRPNMPSAFREFVDKYHLKGDDVIATVTANDFEEVILNMAVIALKLPIDPHLTYFKASLILGQNPVDSVEPFLGKEVEDPVSELIKLSKEVSMEINTIRNALLSSI